MLRLLATAPLAWPFAALARTLGSKHDGIPPVDALDAMLSAPAGVRFVASAPRSGRRRHRAPVDPAAYDASIIEHARVPTRPGNAHDLANALVWAVFPRSKRALHLRQLGVVRAAASAARPGEPWVRSEEGDALAMLDEGGIVVLTDADDRDVVETALRSGDDAAIAARAAVGGALGIVFGHSIVEHLGREGGATVAGLAIAFAGDPRAPDLDAVDASLAARIAEPGSFRTRRGHGIVSARSDVLGTWRGTA